MNRTRIVTATEPGIEPATGTLVPPAEHSSDRHGEDVEAPRPTRASRPAGERAAAGLPQLTKILGTVVAPTTLLTSLRFYFGWSHAYWFFDYFGVNSTLLGLTTRDYVQRSLDGLFVPMTVVACAGLLVLWGHAMLRTRLAGGSRPRVLRILVPAMAVGGLVLAVGGLWSVFAPTLLSRHLVAAPLSLAFEVLLLVYAVHLWRWLTATEKKQAGRLIGPQWVAVAEWVGVFVLVGLSLFWILLVNSATRRTRHGFVLPVDLVGARDGRIVLRSTFPRLRPQDGVRDVDAAAAVATAGPGDRGRGAGHVCQAAGPAGGAGP